MKTVLPIFFFVAIFSLSSCTCERKKEQVITFPTPVETVSARSLEFFNSSFAGVVKSSRVSNLAFKAGGQLIKLNIEDGQKVVKRELIAEIDPNDFQLKLNSAKASYLKSKSQLDRFAQLLKQGAMSRQAFEDAEATFANDKANYNNAVNMLKETKIYAPFSGIIEKRYVENYQRVQAAEPIVLLVDPNDIEMSFTLSESLFSIINADKTEFLVRFEAYPNHKFKAKLTKFVNTSVGGGFPVTVQLDDPEFSIAKYNIRPGFSCTVYVKVYDKDNKGLVAVPATSIYESMESDKDYVWIYNPQTTEVNKKEVIVSGLYGASDVVVEKGLVNGDVVVTAGIYSLAEGQKVKIIQGN